jgi:hypothetical protein
MPAVLIDDGRARDAGVLRELTLRLLERPQIWLMRPFDRRRVTRAASMGKPRTGIRGASDQR